MSKPSRYEVLIDGKEKKSGSLFEDFEPPFNPPEEIDDPEDSKPDDWVDNPKCGLYLLPSAVSSPHCGAGYESNAAFQYATSQILP